jgi:Leucine-rich repeat (LRR) protein
MFPSEIPDELIFKILDLLSLQDQYSVAKTCRKGNTMLQDEHFWLPRIRALAPSIHLSPTKQHFSQLFTRALKETAFLTRNHLKIRLFFQNDPAGMAELDQQLHNLQALCLNPWGENCIANLSNINRLLNTMNLAIINHQLPVTAVSLRLEGITRLPETVLNQHPTLFSTLQKLELLNLYNNPMRYLPDSFAALQNLQFLYLSEGNMPHIPAEIFQLTKLQWLSFSNMHLLEIDKRIGQLKHLTWLYLRDNQITVLPESFYKLVKLRELFLERNPLSPLQFHCVLDLLRKIQFDVHEAFRTQFALLKSANETKKGKNESDVNDLIEKFDLLSMTPTVTPQRASLRKRTLLSSGSEIKARALLL